MEPEALRRQLLEIAKTRAAQVLREEWANGGVAFEEFIAKWNRMVDARRAQDAIFFEGDVWERKPLEREWEELREGTLE
jgi:hypothetical protein